MAPPRKLSPNSVWDSSAVLAAFEEEGIKPLHAHRIWGHLIRHPEATWHDVPDVPKATLALLDRYFVKFTSKVVKCQNSSDGTTTKLLVQLQDGMQVEAVVMTYESTSRDPQVLARAGPEVDPHLPIDHCAVADDDDNDDDDVFHDATEYGDHGPDHGPDGARADATADATANGTGAGEEEGRPAARAEGDESTEPSSSAPSSTAGGPNGAGAGPGRARGRAAAAALVNRLRKRSTLCVSSQVGCQMGCTFCATGTMGLKGNLTAGEIIEQMVHARGVAAIRNVVFMGMGEPLNNYEPVRAAVAMMTDSKGFGLKRRHVTVSTVGVIPRIKQLAEDLPGVSLALSLHAPTQELRSTIVPSARAFKLPALMEAVRHYQRTSSQRVFYEYVMLSGVNDGEEQAHELGKLLKGDDVVVNLIPWNPIYQPEGPFFEAPRDGSVGKFQNILRFEYGLHTTVRQEMGQDISGACGQLVVESGGCGGGGCSKEATRDIEDGVRGVKLGPVA
ncbi:hypothetical protein HYH03_018202 [Edaphochlamys debaryana]|uniref:Radical SAM core domain-containing protein n=1 Tax=Edaphochlamys debaryana TaxID=47281 RepID=A0A835XGF8_9CHLO|nr:hypothetical protein HYH03_018202 [Edaphochlamys debaryana]|eukprot:KAG2482924.1 hypothetical protein HYH03_018202 [Edaphochlamys debaryana]